MRKILLVEAQQVSGGLLPFEDIATLRDVITVNATQILTMASSAAITYYITESPYITAASSCMGYIAGYEIFKSVIMPFYERKDSESYR